MFDDTILAAFIAGGFMTVNTIITVILTRSLRKEDDRLSQEIEKDEREEDNE